MVTPPTHRLPRTVLPERYELEIVPDLDNRTFAGSVAVDLAVHEAVDEIVCNAVALTITEAELTTPAGAVHRGRVRYLEEAEQAALRFDEAVPIGRGSRLRLAFHGELRDALSGFYRSTFTDAGGVVQAIGVTQFEATDARRAFPCWDEPDMKATFAVSLVVPDGLTALSSGACVSDVTIGGGRRRIRFAETIPMSTYVLAWVLGPFELTEPADAGGVPVRVAAPVGRLGLTPFSLDVAVHALGYLSAYFGLPYPGDKVDHVAIPDFAFGAMENFGCVTYRENALLADTASASQAELSRVARVIAHETAHMWFGDMVTMRWWDGIWLNEAFATFMELKTADDFRPDWGVWTVHAGAKAESMAVDGLRSTRPIEYSVVAPQDADAMFDVLTYEKGASVLRMLEHFVGEETFRRGISRYLSEHRFANTESTDLWDALEAVSGQPIRTTMDSWIRQAGYPLVEVERGSLRSEVALSQRRFSYLGGVDGHWSVPITLRASAGGTLVERRLLLDEPATVDLGAPVDWVVANQAGAGYYRTRCEPSLRPPLGELAAHCSPIERVHLVGDTWATVVAGSSNLEELLGLVTALGTEDDPDVWRAVAGPLTLLERIADKGAIGPLRRFVTAVAGRALAPLGWDPPAGETARRAMTRGRLIMLLGTVGADPGTRAEATSRHGRYRRTGSGLSPDVLTAAVTTIASAGGEGAYDLLLRCYREALTPQDRIRYLFGLSYFDEPALVERTLDLALAAEVRSQDAPLLIGGLLAGAAGGEVVWPWIEEHADAIVSRFPQTLLIRILESVPMLADAKLAERVHGFLAAHPWPVARPRIDQIEEQLDIAAALAARLRPTLASDLALG